MSFGKTYLLVLYHDSHADPSLPSLCLTLTIKHGSCGCLSLETTVDLGVNGQHYIQYLCDSYLFPLL